MSAKRSCQGHPGSGCALYDLNGTHCRGGSCVHQGFFNGLLVIDQGLETIEARRAVLYLSLLATEVAIKAMLEKAGEPPSRIRRRSHDLSGLLKDLGKCRIEVEAYAGANLQVSASRIRAIHVQAPNGQITVGKILEAEAAGASRYPNQVRYGPLLRHYPAEVVAAMSSQIVAFAERHWSTLQKPSSK